MGNITDQSMQIQKDNGAYRHFIENTSIIPKKTEGDGPGLFKQVGRLQSSATGHQRALSSYLRDSHSI